MKEQEIIHYIFKDDMPDIDQVFENCISAVPAGKSYSFVKRRVRMQLVAAIIALCVLLTGGAYAAVRLLWEPAEQADTGGSWVMIPVPEDYYDDNDSGDETRLLIYSSQLVQQPVFDAEIAERLSELMARKFFTEDKDPIDLLVYGAYGYSADDRGGTIYDARGNRADMIYYEVGRNGAPLGIMHVSIDITEVLNDYSDSYAESASFLGQDFRIPSVYTDGFDEPRFNIQDDTLYGINRQRKAVYVSIGGEPGMYFFVEQMRAPGEAAREWGAENAEIFKSEIAGVEVYKIVSGTDTHSIQRYTWNHEGLTYMFFNFIDRQVAFTDEQCEEIIKSMIQ